MGRGGHLPKFGVPPWLMALSMFLCYIGFMPTALFCSYSEYLLYAMYLFCFSTVFLECVVLVERHGRKNNEQQKVGTLQKIFQDVVELGRVLMTTFLPILFLTWGGASFLLVVKLYHSADGYSVSELGRLSDQGFMAFKCVDGYVAADMQEGVVAWHETSGRRLRVRMRVQHHSSHHGNETSGAQPQLGYVAPIFQSQDTYLKGDPPFAWAVKAGRKVSVSHCREFAEGTCGIFVKPLQTVWSTFVAPPHFGENWGFNITHFDSDLMKRTRESIKNSNPRASWGDGDEPFVIAEEISTYFGSAVQCLYVTITLLLVGFVDRLLQLSHWKDLKPTSAEEEGLSDEESVDQVESLPLNDEQLGRRGYLTEMLGMWNDPLNTPPEPSTDMWSDPDHSPVSSRMKSREEPPQMYDDEPETVCGTARTPRFHECVRCGNGVPEVKETYTEVQL